MLISVKKTESYGMFLFNYVKHTVDRVAGFMAV